MLKKNYNDNSAEIESVLPDAILKSDLSSERPEKFKVILIIY